MPPPADPERRSSHAAPGDSPGESEGERRSATFASFGVRESTQSGAVLAGRYQVRGFLTRGSTARVYLAEDLVTHAPVVVKMLAPETAASAEFRSRLLREAEAAKAVVHPNVVTVLDAGQTDEGAPFLVLEALLGESLGEYLRREGTIPLDTALILLKQAAAGLAAAHRAGVVHRDVKPDNFLLLGPRGEPYGLKVIDFGLAKLWTSGDGSGAHNILGTAEYMAPEQILVEQVDPRSDVYSLGVVMFRALTGHLPFESVGQADLLRHQLFSSVPPPSWLNEDLESGVDYVVGRATRKHRENRYPTMDALIADLDVLLGLDAREIAPPMLVVTPDIYVPTSERGREAANLLAEKFGQHASSIPSSRA
ncbi:MAG TPA: serine/threonine-protein kinase [Polyangiaceae bacterium]|jgi:serine/threonine-protein kinase|nr:serine/threonine-protein kinase [Polyangiaceae bacterium]